MTTKKFFYPSLMLLVWDPGSVIRDKHPRSATLAELVNLHTVAKHSRHFLLPRPLKKNDGWLSSKIETERF
jgi:hypothetical protein